MAALGCCLAAGIHAKVVAQHIAVLSLDLDLEADVYTTAVWSACDVSPEPIGFKAIRVSVLMQADAPRERLESLAAHATPWSPVANTLHNPVHLDVALADRGPERVSPAVMLP